MTTGEALAFLTQSTTALIAIANPIGAVPIFLTMTEGTTAAERTHRARQAVVAVTAILVATALFGRLVLGMFGLSLDAFRAAGGLVILLMGLEMLRGERTRVQAPHPDVEREEREVLADSIVVPFAMPMIAGPGAITTTMTLASQADGVVGHALLFAAIGALAVVLALALRSARAVDHALGPRGQRIFLRFMGLILLTLGAQFLLSGARDYLLAT